MRVFFLYPEGRRKALTFSFDDGLLADLRMLEIMNRFQLKGTWNLNSGLLGEGTVPADRLAEIYQGHEIACHGSEHGHLTFLPMEEIITDIREDRRFFEAILHHPVTGMAYPNGYTAEWLSQALRVLGIRYCRTVRSTERFLLPEDFILWDPTCHYRNAPALVEKFLHQPVWAKLPLFYIWGHSYELDRNQEWELFEKLCSDLAGDPDTWYATNGEICTYVQAVRSLICGVDTRFITNPTATRVWLKGPEGKPVSIGPGETIPFKA